MRNLTLFSQIISMLPRSKFQTKVSELDTDKFNKGCTSWTHLVSMLFCQFANSASLRDISNGLRSSTGNLSHLGIKTAPSKSTLSYQNKNRDWKLFRNYYYELLNYFGQQKDNRRVKFRIKSKILLLDSSVITLCLTSFDWAKYHRTKGAVKIHTLLNYDSKLPEYIHITNGKVGDNTGAKLIKISSGSVVVADRAYHDFALLNIWDSTGVKFVIRHKNPMVYEVIKSNDLPKNKKTTVINDEIIKFIAEKGRKKYPKKIRRVVVWDKKKQEKVEFLTNQFTWSADTISQLYKSRWDIEIFFREVKQLLSIKSFIGTSENAVMIQIWAAMITILMFKVIKAKAKHKWCLSNLVSFIRLNTFVKFDLTDLLNKPFNIKKKSYGNIKQGVLFEI